MKVAFCYAVKRTDGQLHTLESFGSDINIKFTLEIVMIDIVITITQKC